MKISRYQNLLRHRRSSPSNTTTFWYHMLQRPPMMNMFPKRNKVSWKMLSTHHLTLAATSSFHLSNNSMFPHLSSEFSTRSGPPPVILTTCNGRQPLRLKTDRSHKTTPPLRTLVPIQSSPTSSPPGPMEKSSQRTS